MGWWWSRPTLRPMPVEFLTDDEAAAYGRYADAPSQADLREDTKPRPRPGNRLRSPARPHLTTRGAGFAPPLPMISGPSRRQLCRLLSREGSTCGWW